MEGDLLFLLPVVLRSNVVPYSAWNSIQTRGGHSFGHSAVSSTSGLILTASAGHRRHPHRLNEILGQPEPILTLTTDQDMLLQPRCLALGQFPQRVPVEQIFGDVEHGPAIPQILDSPETPSGGTTGRDSPAGALLS